MGWTHLALPRWGLFPMLRPEVGARPAPRSPGFSRTRKKPQCPLGGPAAGEANSDIKPSIRWGNFFQGLLGWGAGLAPRPTQLCGSRSPSSHTSLTAEGAEAEGGDRGERKAVGPEAGK